MVTLQTRLQTHATINSSSSAVAGVSWLEGCEWTLTTMLRPMTEFGPVSVILLSFTLMTASPFSSANTLPKSPTCLYKYPTTRTALGRVHVPPTKVFPTSHGSQWIKHYKTTPCCSDGARYLYMGFSRCNKIPHYAHMITVKAIRFRHPDYNLDHAQKLISSSMSRYLSTRNISSKSMHVFLSNLPNLADRQMRANAFTSCLRVCRT